MVTKIPLVSLGVQRDGKTVYPKIGKPFEYTAEEITAMNDIKKETKVDQYRNPVNETADVDGDGKPDDKKKGGKGTKTDKKDGDL